MNDRITILSSQELKLKNWLNSDPHGHERGAIVLFRRISRPVKNLKKSDRFIAVEIIEMKDDWIIESSMTHMKINMRKFPDIYLKCELKELELGFVHNHPSGSIEFSPMDDENEINIMQGVSNCNGESSYLISMILCGDKWIGRIRNGSELDKAYFVRHISILGDSISLHGISKESFVPESLLRQEAAFGKPFNQKLRSLRVAVIGAGGTGSPVATLLARIGIGELIIIDNDILENSNMNRVRGYRIKDIGKQKATSLCEYIKELGLSTDVIAIEGYLGSSGTAIDAISSADIIIGCTDDIAGRDILNQALYYYCQTYIDLGMSGMVDENLERIPYLRSQKGRISCILPEVGACLRCQDVVNDQKLHAENEFKLRPGLKELDADKLEKEYYIIGGGVQAPGIGPFTSATADIGISTLMNLIKPFRVLPTDLRQDNIWIDFVNLSFHSNEPRDNTDCIFCGTHAVLLKNEGKYRLEMPSLGEIPKNE